MSTAADETTERHPRVLVVDDEASITRLVSTVLRYEAFDVECAEDGTTAIKRVGSFHPDLVVLDVVLPRPHDRRGCTRGATRRSRCCSSHPLSITCCATFS